MDFVFHRAGGAGRTEGGGEKTEGGGRRTEDRRQRGVGGNGT